MICRTDSKKHCEACEHLDYCDKANRCNGDCHLCDDYDCENNPKYQQNKEKPKMDKKKIDFNELYALCNREQFFTCGDVQQYQKMFDIAKDGVTQMELAYILYICSKYRLDFIYDRIAHLFSKEDN